MHNFVSVSFIRFKAFERFRVDLRSFNILVGPNNAGKSTVLAGFRILAAAMRKAESRRAEVVSGPNGSVPGHVIDLAAISVAEENIFFNYDDSEPASIRFLLSTQYTLTLYFPKRYSCLLIPDALGKQVWTPTHFKSNFKCKIGFVPILGPVEHHEPLYGSDAARLALFNYKAARNFRNIWYHYPEKFEKFRETLHQTWPGMDISLPEIDNSYNRSLLRMFCPELRIPREIFWSGFGFQVWCQMLTHLIQSSSVSMFLIDEPDIYLHSELQRQLLGILRTLGPDILIATHSTEIITEAEPDDIVLINKQNQNARRIKNPSQLGEIFSLLGSNINPILTQLAKTRRALFVEGKDFQILGKFARRLGKGRIGDRADFAVIPVQGFNPERIRSLQIGIQTTLGSSIVAGAVLDRDFRSKGECNAIKAECLEFCDQVHIHNCKEIENFLLVPDAIDRAARQKLADRAKRTATDIPYTSSVALILHDYCKSRYNYITAQYLAARRSFERATMPGKNETTVSEEGLAELAGLWTDDLSRFKLVPGKDALSHINKHLQDNYGVSVTPTAIIDSMKLTEVLPEMVALVESLSHFSTAKPQLS